MQITISVSDDLGHRLQRVQDRLPQLMAWALDVFTAEQLTSDSSDEAEVISVLTSHANPQKILMLRPSPKFQARINELSNQLKQGTLSLEDERELARYRQLEHLVRLAKIHAAEKLSKTL